MTFWRGNPIEWKSGSSLSNSYPTQCQAPKRGVNHLLENLMENHANNPDDSEQESADKHRVMSPFPASGSLSEGEERPVAGRQDQRPGNIPHFPFILASLLGIISRNVLVILFLQWLVLFGLDEVFSSQWTKHSLEAHTSAGVCSYTWQLWSSSTALPRHSQDLHFPYWAD